MQWDKSPILQDQQSNIFVRFDAKEPDDFIRIIKLYFDQGDVVELKIEGQVIK